MRGRVADVSELAGSRVVVVGGSSGMGLATARMAGEAGATVRIVGRDEKRLASAVKSLGRDTDSVRADAAVAADMEHVFADLERVDHVVVFAGEQPLAPLADAGLGMSRPARFSAFWGPMVLAKPPSPA